MQTRMPASAEANKQQSHSAQHPAQLVAEQQSAFEDHSSQAAQLTSLQAMMSNSPPQHRTQAIQAKMNGSAQAQQMRTLKASMAGGVVAQREELEEPLQAQVDGEAVQREEVAAPSKAPNPNNTGLPDKLKSGIESLSGMSMDHVKVHYNSSQPAQLNAHAYAQGSEIHVAPGQEQHVPHEAWHVVQQAQGRVKPTVQMKGGVPVNDDVGLEAEADVMGAKALELRAVQMHTQGNDGTLELTPSPHASSGTTQLRHLPNIANQNMPLQFAGSEPYKPEIRLQTPYMVLAFRFPEKRPVAAAEVDEYFILNVTVHGRPPVYQSGVQMANQGQHKVAWRAIWGALETLIGLSIGDADDQMNAIIAGSGVPMVPEAPLITPVGVEANGSPTKSPALADALLINAHTYLCSKQRDDPSWESDDPDQLKGKGETALKTPLHLWQEAQEHTPAKILRLFTPGDPWEANMSRLVDTTDRDAAETDDARERARVELYTHNPDAYPTFEAAILAWLATK